MKSDVYKQAALGLDLGGGRHHPTDPTDEEEACCTCSHDVTDSFSFCRSGSFGRKDDVTMRRSTCPADEAACSSCTAADTRRCEGGGGGGGRGGPPTHHRIRWADDCHRELTRQHPRKKYVRRPAHPPPLKSILKGT